jgi:hypothetical protein
MNTFLTLVVPDDDAALARTIAATLSSGGAGMWTTPLSSDGSEPATHWVSSGLVPEAWMYMVPVRTYEQQDDTGAWILVSQTPGDLQAVIAGCSAAGVTIDPDALAALYASADVTQQDPWVAFDRLGVTIVQPQDAAA